MPQVETEYGTFGLSRRASWGFSVIRVKRACRHHYRPVAAGDYVIVEHRKRPMFACHIATGWGEHVATYDRDGNEIDLRARNTNP